MNLNELWELYEADKRIQGFSPGRGRFTSPQNAKFG